MQKSATSSFLEANKALFREGKDQEEDTVALENDIECIESENLDVTWVWNNVITRDKMRRKSVAGFAPIVQFEKQKRYRVIQRK